MRYEGRFSGREWQTFPWGRMRYTMFCRAFPIDSTTRPFLTMRERMTELSGSRMKAPAMSTLHLSGFDRALSFQPLIIFRGNESPSAPLQCFTLFPSYFCSEPSNQERCRNFRHTMLTLGPRLHLCVCVYNYISCLIAWAFQLQLNRPSRSVDSGKIPFRPYPNAPL